MEVLHYRRMRLRRWKKRRNYRLRRRQAVKAGKQTTQNSKCANIHVSQEPVTDNMEARAFWENYNAAIEWQRKHTVAWWKSRCLALEHENQILRSKLRSDVVSKNWQNLPSTSREPENVVPEGTEEEKKSEEEDFVFEVNEDMMNFLEKSMRHKMELKQKKRESRLAAEMEEGEQRGSAQKQKQEQFNIEGGAAWVRARNEGGKRLYGTASSRILAMETALEATVDRYKDQKKPQFWPQVPLKIHFEKL